MRSLLIALPLALCTMLAAPAAGQATPDRLYHGINRPIPFTVEAPEDAERLQLALYGPTADSIIARAEVDRGAVDLFEVFPILWNRTDTPHLYLQLLVAGEPYGPPVFLEALRPPMTKTIDPRTNQIVWDTSQRRRPYTGLRTYPMRLLVFETSEGAFTMKLRPDQAPNTARHILELVEGGFYSDIVVHRIIPANANGDPFVIQFGDPRGFGLGGPGSYIDLEPSELEHGFGVVSMARQGDNPDSNGSQLFIALSRAGTRHLDGNYTAFAEIVGGVETILALEDAEIADLERGVPAEPKPVVESARAIPAPPINRWPDRIRRPAPAGVDQTR